MSRCSVGLRALMLAGVLILPACGVPLPFSGGASTPSAAAIQSHNQPGSAYKVIATRTWGNRAAVMGVDSASYSTSGLSPGQTSCYEIVAYFVAGFGSGWEPSSSSCGGSAAPSSTKPLVCGSIESGSDSLGLYTIVLGLVRTPDVAQVEISFASGQILSDASPDGAFAVSRPALDSPTGLRLLDSNKKELYKTTLSGPSVGGIAPPSGQTGSSISTFASASEPIDCQP